MKNHLAKKSIKEELIARRKGDCKLGRNYEPWRNEEIELLAGMYYGGEDISAIAVVLERSEFAVFSRLRIEGILQEANRKNISHNIGYKCKCSNCEMNCTKSTEFCKYKPA